MKSYRPQKPRWSGDLARKLVKAKVRTLDEFKNNCAVGSTLETEDYSYEITEIKGDWLRMKRSYRKTGGHVAYANLKFEMLWNYYKEGRLF